MVRLPKSLPPNRRLCYQLDRFPPTAQAAPSGALCVLPVKREGRAPGPIIGAEVPMRPHSLPSTVLMLALAFGPLLGQKKKSHVNGTWDLKVGAHTYRIAFEEEDGDVRGTVTLPNGESTEIEYGLIFGDDLEFLTVENGVEHEWTAKVNRNAIKGERVNLDEETAVKFSARRAR